jgi:hypothetical protein
LKLGTTFISRHADESSEWKDVERGIVYHTLRATTVENPKLLGKKEEFLPDVL